jgi:hypothetical protein
MKVNMLRTGGCAAVGLMTEGKGFRLLACRDTAAPVAAWQGTVSILAALHLLG